MTLCKIFCIYLLLDSSGSPVSEKDNTICYIEIEKKIGNVKQRLLVFVLMFCQAAKKSKHAAEFALIYTE